MYFKILKTQLLEKSEQLTKFYMKILYITKLKILQARKFNVLIFPHINDKCFVIF